VSADAQGFRHNLVQEIFWTRTGLLLLSLLVISGTCLGIDSIMAAGALKTFVGSVGTGTLISAIIGFGQTLITSSASQRALVTPLVEESRKALQELNEQYRSLNHEFYPTHIFEPTTEPDPNFNRLMMQDLRNTKEYFFRGFSGRYAAARLLLSSAEWELRTVIADPRGPSALSGRARYLLRRDPTAEDYEVIEKRLHDEISVGLVGLYQARSRCSRVDMTIITDPPLDRLEMFDDSVWLTLFSDAAGASALYPRTLRFSEGSFIYAMERNEFLRVCNSRAGRHFVITPDTSRQEFLALFETITGTELTESGFRALDEKFRDFERQFSTSVGLRS
jgi:hypothetical protein